MKLSVLSLVLSAVTGLASASVFAAGMVPQSSVVIVEEQDGEGSIDIKNSDSYPNLLITKIENIQEDTEELVTVFPPVTRVEGHDMQTVRFLLTNDQPLQVERMKRVTFEGVPPKNSELNKEINVTFKQNLPMIIRPKGLKKNLSPWIELTWSLQGNQLKVSNPSPYVVRFISNEVQTKTSQKHFELPQSYILPNQSFVMEALEKKAPVNSVQVDEKVMFYPATTWGFSYGKAVESPVK